MSDYNIGNIYAELSVDTTSLEVSKRKAIKELGNLRDEGAKILKEAGGKMTEAMKIRLDEIEKNKSAILKNINELNTQIREKLNPTKAILGQEIESAIMAPLKAFASSSIETFSQFQQSMQNTFSVMGANANDMQLLEEAAKKMGETTRFSASQASQALYSLGSAGQSATEAVNSLQGVLQLAGATGSDLAYTSETIASTLSQFNLEAGKASHIADVYAKAISKSQANMTKLSYSMKYVGPVASGLGISLETTTAALMKLYNTGYGGEQAGTYLKQAFQKLASGTQDLKNKLQELGISYEEVNPQTRNFADIINTLKEKNIGVTESIAIFGETAGGAMAKLIEEGGDAIATMEGLLKSSEGAAAEMQNIQNASFANTKAELSSAMEAVQITIGSILEPAMNGLLSGVTELLKGFNSLPVGIQTFITTMATASTAIVPFLTMPALITKIKDAMKALNTTMLHNPIFIAGAVVTAVASIAYSVYSQVKKSREDMVREAKKGVEDIKEMQRKAQEAGDKGRNIQNLLRQYETLKDKTNKTKEEQEKYNQTLKNLTNLVPNVVTGVSKTGEAFIKNTGVVKRAILEQLRLEKDINAQRMKAMRYRAMVAKQAEERILKEQAQSAEKDKEMEDRFNMFLKLSKKIENSEKNGYKEHKGVWKELKAFESATGYEITTEKKWNDATQGYDKVERSYKDAIKAFEEKQKEFLTASKEYYERVEKNAQELIEVRKTQAELKDLETSNKEIDKILKGKTPKVIKKEKKDIVATYKEKREETLKKIKQEQKDKRLNIDILEKEEELLMKDLSELIEMDVSQIKEGVKFSSLDVELQEIYNRIDYIRKIRNTPKTTSQPTPEKKEEEPLKLDFIDKTELEYKEKQRKLKEALFNIRELQAEIASREIKKEKTESDIETITYYQNLIEDLQQKAQSLSAELGQDYVLLGDIDAKIAELDQKDTNSFTSKFKAIQNVKKATIKAIGEAQTAGNIDEKTAEEKIKKINAVALKATVTVGAELTKTILSVGNNVTDIILGAIAKGEISLGDAFDLVSQIGGQIADMIPDPTAKAIIGAAQMGINLIKKIVNFAENVRKENEEALKKALDEDDKKRQERARTLAGDTAQFYTKQLAMAKKGANSFDDILNEMANKTKNNALQDAIKTLGDVKTKLLKDVQVEVQKTEWYWYQDKYGTWLLSYGKHTVTEWQKAKMSVNELIIEWKKAIEKGDGETAKKIKEALEDAQKEHFKAKGVNPDEIENLKNYMQDIEGAFVDAIKQKDFGALKDAMREKIRDAMLAKLQQSIIFSKLTPLLQKLEKAEANQKNDVMAEIEREMEKSYKNYETHAERFMGTLGLVSTEIEEHRKAWRGLKSAITEALSSSLGEAAYNADWDSFKKAFASEMKKAIISSTVANAGFKTKIDNIIKDIMKDGKITADEVNNSIDELQSYFDQLEGKLEPLAKITKALEGGVDVKSEHAGTIIQQLSGADRDFFAEEFRKNFTTMGDSFKSAMIDLKEIHQAKIIVEMATLTVHDIYINAGSVADLKTLIAEMIEEARRAG